MFGLGAFWGFRVWMNFVGVRGLKFRGSGLQSEVLSLGRRVPASTRKDALLSASIGTRLPIPKFYIRFRPNTMRSCMTFR